MKRVYTEAQWQRKLAWQRAKRNGTEFEKIVRKCEVEGHKRSADGRNCLTCQSLRMKAKAKATPGYYQAQYLKEKARPDFQTRQRERYSRHKYGVVISAEGPCAICGKPATDVDHDHETGEIRGFLCRYCNVRVGILENAEFVADATDYLKRHAPNNGQKGTQ